MISDRIPLRTKTYLANCEKSQNDSDDQQFSSELGDYSLTSTRYQNVTMEKTHVSMQS